MTNVENEPWRMPGYFKFNQVVTPVAATILHRVLLLEQITIFFGYAAITLGHCIETLC